MFSEYASRFLAQSQSRLSNFAGQGDNNNNTSDPAGRPLDGPSRYSRLPARSTYQGRLGNPYQPNSGSRFGNLSFASRYNTQPDAPLFHSALNEFEQEDDEDAREAADLRALQRSRRVFVASRLDESSASENDLSRVSLDQSEDRDSRAFDDRDRPMGIKSSWNGESSFKSRRLRQKQKDETEGPGNWGSRRQNSGSDDSNKMEDVGLESQVMENDGLENDVPEDLLHETPVDSRPPAFQQFKTTPGTAAAPALPVHEESNFESDARLLRTTTNDTDTTDDSLPPSAGPPPIHGEIFTHDPFFAWVYLIAVASLMATYVLVWLHTTAPSGGKNRLGDTIYTTLRSSFYLLAVDTVVSIIVSLVWLAALRSFVRPLVVFILVGVPIVLFSFTLYPMISSYQGPDNGSRLQDVMMRWAAIVPGISAIVWVYLVYKGRYALSKAIQILEFSSRILAANPALLLLGFLSLACVVAWTWIWLWMFTRVFLGGYFSKRFSAFIINAATWWIGVFFFVMYIWTLSVMSGVVRATTAGTVSNWYFHRNKQPPAPSNAIVSEALQHAVTGVFGTICASTLLSLVVRLPLIILPRRLASLLGFFAYQFVPTPIAALTNPLALTYAAIHSTPLMEGASGLSRMQFLSNDTPTTSLTPRSFSRRGSAGPLLPYRLAKLLLHAARFVMSTALGFAAWVMTARQLQVTLPDGIGIRGSAYAYVVGLVASVIGWGILGAMEGILSGILDGVVICYGSERRMGSGRIGYCKEAEDLFGDRDDERDMV